MESGIAENELVCTPIFSMKVDGSVAKLGAF